MKEPEINYMVDLETLGITPGSIILSVGVAPFNTYMHRIKEFPSFYQTVSIESCKQEGFLPEDKSTLEWWNKQKPEVKEEAFSGTLPIRTVLLNLTEYLAHNNPNIEANIMWGNAASFDLKLLEAAYYICQLQVPWKFYNERCFRTLKNLFPYVKPVDSVGPKHNALADASNQAKHAEAILSYLVSRGVYFGSP